MPTLNDSVNICIPLTARSLRGVTDSAGTMPGRADHAVPAEGWGRRRRRAGALHRPGPFWTIPASVPPVELCAALSRTLSGCSGQTGPSGAEGPMPVLLGISNLASGGAEGWAVRRGGSRQGW